MKVAISVPDPVFNAADRLAKQRWVPRSQRFTEALQEYMSRHDAAAVTAARNEIYQTECATLEEPLASAQYASIEHATW